MSTKAMRAVLDTIAAGTFRALSLCCGGGIGESRGQPWPVALAIDIDKPARDAYKLNAPDVPTWWRDIADPQTLEDAVQFLGGHVPVIQSFAPCTDFSAGKEKPADERRTSATNDLFLSAIDYVERLRPLVFIAENVPGLVSQIPDGRYRTHHYPAAVLRLRRMSYQVQTWMIDARDFGSAQRRKRVFLVAVAEGLPQPIEPRKTHGPRREFPWRTWDDAMEGLTERAAYAEGCLNLSAQFRWLFRGIPPGENWEHLERTAKVCPGNAERLRYVYKVYGGRPYNNQAASRMRNDRHSHTLLTSPVVIRTVRSMQPGGTMTGAPKWVMHPTTGDIFIIGGDGKHRPVSTNPITVRQTARLFDVPDSYQFPVGMTPNKYAIAGNGVCAHAWLAVTGSVWTAISGNNPPPVPPWRLIAGDALDELRKMETETVDCVVTSVPYFQLRDYEVEGQYGMESSVEEYLERMVEVFREVRLVLKPTGTCWLNIGDTYSEGKAVKKSDIAGRLRRGHKRPTIRREGKPGDCLDIPGRLGQALRKDGWYLRSEIVWHKVNANNRPYNRPNSKHEKILMLTKEQSGYWWDGSNPETARSDVWTFGRAVVSKNKPHCCPFPPKLPRRCILAGCPPGGLVLDPFAGSGTTGIVALEHGRKFVGIELHPEYAKMAECRLTQAQFKFDKKRKRPS